MADPVEREPLPDVVLGPDGAPVPRGPSVLDLAKPEEEPR